MMNKFKSIMRCSALGVALTGSLGLIQQAQALPGVPIGQCEPMSGSPKIYNFDFTQTLISPEMNVAGKEISDASKNSPWTTGLGGTYYLKCGCSGAIYNESFISAQPVSTTEVHNVGGRRYFAMASNEYLAVASEVHVAGSKRKRFPVPFETGNGWTNAKHDCNNPRGIEYESGSRGVVHLYFRRPFVGVTTFNETLLKIYINSAPNAGRGKPVAEVHMTGSVTVPQQCDISGGMTIPVEFGDIMATSFKTAGQIPVGFNKVHKELTLKCRNISDGVKISLSFQGTPDPRFNDALKTEDNEDIAVRLEDAAGKVIPVMTGRLPTSMVGLGQLESAGKADVYLYPIKTGDKLPAAGKFHATATVRAEIE